MPREVAGLGVSMGRGLLLALVMSRGSGRASLVWVHFRLRVRIVVGRAFVVLGIGKEMSCAAGLTLICSCVRKGIPSTASEFARGATRKSAGFLEVQFFEEMLILALIFSLYASQVERLADADRRTYWKAW